MRQETITMMEAEDLRRARLTGTRTAFGAGLLEGESGGAKLTVVDGVGRVGRRRRPRRGARPQVAA